MTRDRTAENRSIPGSPGNVSNTQGTVPSSAHLYVLHNRSAALPTSTEATSLLLGVAMETVKPTLDVWMGTHLSQPGPSLLPGPSCFPLGLTARLTSTKLIAGSRFLPHLIYYTAKSHNDLLGTSVFRSEPLGCELLTKRLNSAAPPHVTGRALARSLVLLLFLISCCLLSLR